MSTPSPIGDLVRRIPVSSWALVVHIGAGSSPESLNLSDVARLVLVEGDAGTRLQLALVATKRPEAQILPDVVLAEAGLTAWYRYNLPRLNGPLEQLDLLSVYPRLRALGSSFAQGTSLAGLLRRVLGAEAADDAAPLPNDDANRLLIFDVPGQESTLLKALPDALLHRFEWLAVRERAVSEETADKDELTEVRLLAAGYRCALSDLESEPLWPLRLYRLHWPVVHAARLGLLEEQLRAIERAGAEAMQQARQQLEAERTEALVTARAAEGRAAAACQERDELAQRLALSEARLEEVCEERNALLDRVEPLSMHAEAAATLRVELEAAVARSRTELDAVHKQVSELQAENEQLTEDRNQQRQWHHDNATWAQSLKRELEVIKAQHDQQQQALDDARSEAALAARAELDLAREELKAEGERIAALTAERDQERRWHLDNANWAKSLKAENDKLAQEIESLRRRQAEDEDRSRLLDQEVLRAEAQLDLIKDVLLREKNF